MNKFFCCHKYIKLFKIIFFVARPIRRTASGTIRAIRPQFVMVRSMSESGKSERDGRIDSVSMGR
jgi:hypothetical protein